MLFRSVVAPRRNKPPATPTCHVLKEDALDRIAAAELENLLGGGIDQQRHVEHILAYQRTPG